MLLSNFKQLKNHRCSHAVKHFKVKVSQEGIEFGQEIFLNLDSFLHHFDNCPLIGDDTGLLNNLIIIL